MKTFLRRATLHLVNQSSIPVLMKRLQKGTEGELPTPTAQNARMWLTWLSKHQAPLYKHHVGELSKAIATEQNEVIVEVSLQALSAVAQWDKKLAPSDRWVHCNKCKTQFRSISDIDFGELDGLLNACSG
jgi:sister chromatid cohesion protein PDS5